MKDIIAAINWPGVTLLLGGLALIIFRAQIRLLLNRTKKLSPGGLETYDTQQKGTSTDTKAEVDKFMSSYDNPVLLEQEAAIRTDLTNRNLIGSPENEKVLVRALAATQIVLHFERAYQSIWASQIMILIYLNSQSEGANNNEVKKYYDGARERFPDMYKTYTFENYMAFLESFLLVTRTGDKWNITKGGREFLKFMIDTGKSGPIYG